MSGKKFADATKQYERDRFYTPNEALGIVKQMATAKFDENVDIAFRLGVDPRKADQMVRGTVALPSGTGKDVRVAVFATGEAADAAREAGADIVGADDLAAAVESGKMDFDLAIATPDMMPLVGKLGRVLGPRRGRIQGWQGRVPHGPLRQCAPTTRQVELRTASDRGELCSRARRDPAGQTCCGQGQVHQEGHRLGHDGPRCSRGHQPSPTP